MSEVLAWVIAASTLTAVADWAGWHFVWRHEVVAEGKGVRKRTITSFLISYVIPFLPALAVGLGPELLKVYDQGFAIASGKILFVLMGILTAGLTASGYSWKSRHDESAKSRDLTGQGELLPKEAMEHLTWTTTLIGLASISWWALLFL